VAITLAGYTYAGTTLVVDGDEAETYSMAKIVFTPPADEDQVTAWSRVYDEDAALEPDATLMIQQTKPGARNIYDGKIKTLTADANGLVSHPVWADGSEYRISRDGPTWSDPFAPEDDEDESNPNTYRLPGVVGNS
jgi:hypothetical protein